MSDDVFQIDPNAPARWSKALTVKFPRPYRSRGKRRRYGLVRVVPDIVGVVRTETHWFLALPRNAIRTAERLAREWGGTNARFLLDAPGEWYYTEVQVYQTKRRRRE